jgi:hypothetical protein
LARDYGAPPFSVMDARQGYWRDRGRTWMDAGLRGEPGRSVKTFSPSAQGPDIYRFKRELERQMGRTLPWPEALKRARAAGYRPMGGMSVFDPALCELLYCWFSPAGARVLDPFAGGHTRGVVAAAMGRAYTGVDLSAKQVRVNRSRAETLGLTPEWIVGDSAEVLGAIEGEYDLLLSCPPYADLEKYSDDPRDLSAMPYDAFLKAHAEIVRLAVARLCPDRFAVWVIGDVRDKAGCLRGLPASVAAHFEAAGCRLYNHAILAQNPGSAAIRARGMFRARKLCPVHQHVLVFAKGDPRRAAAYCGRPELCTWPALTRARERHQKRSES